MSEVPREKLLMIEAGVMTNLPMVPRKVITPLSGSGAKFMAVK